MPEESADYEVADGLPEDQEEDEENIKALTVRCPCGAELMVIAGNANDLFDVCTASGWWYNLKLDLFCCSRCEPWRGK